MTTLKNIASIILSILLGLGISGCSENEDIFNKVNNDSDYLFVVNASFGEDTRAASDGKTSWSENDVIIISIDGSNTNLCSMTYKNGDWNVEKLINTAIFTNNTGSLHAVYADQLSYDSGIISTKGDILYTKDGTYAKDGSIIYINLRMNKRPVAKIKVSGIPEDYWIDGLKEFNKLNIAEMSWLESYSSSDSYKEIEDDNTITFYGTLAAEGNDTTVKLTNKEGKVYAKSFKNKVIKEGNYILITGPISNDEWSCSIPLTGLSSRKNATMMLGSTASAYDYFDYLPNGTTETGVAFSSSNYNIVTVDENGNLSAKSKGNATITVKSLVSDYTCTFDVSVGSIEDYVSVRLTGNGITISGGIYYMREYTIYNNSPVDIYLETISTSNSISIGRTLKANSSYEQELYLSYNIYPEVTIKYTYNGRTYSVKCK